MNQVALEPTAVAEAIETGVATGKTAFYYGYTRDEDFRDRKRWPIERMAEALMDRAAGIYGVRPDQIACAPTNVAALERIEGVRVLRRPEGPVVVSADTVFFGWEARR